MGFVKDTADHIRKYPLEFLVLGAAAAVVVPVAAVTLAPALRPHAKRIVRTGLNLMEGLQVVAAEAQEAFSDLIAEVELDSLASEVRSNDNETGPQVNRERSARGSSAAAA